MILAIDQGTSGTTVLLIDQDGSVIDRAYREITQYYPSPGWVEHDPVEIIGTVIDLCWEILSRSHVKPHAIGITNQRETVVLWNRKTGQPVYNAIVWQDRRTAKLCESLQQYGDIFRRNTGLLIDPYFSGPKLSWLLGSDASIRNAAWKGDLIAGTIDTWLLWNLTGGKSHFTDITNAARTLCCDIRTGSWSDELLSILKLPRTLLPEIRPSRSQFGLCMMAPLDGIAVTGIAGDQQAALFGQGCITPGLAKNTYGTGCFLLSYCGSNLSIPAEPVLVTTACSGLSQNVYALEGSVFIAGAAVKWLRDEMKLIQTSDECETIAASVPDSAGVYVVPAFTGLGAPYWDADARGAILGLTRGAGRPHIVRAVLESIAYQTADLMSIGCLKHIRELRVDGGACRNNFLMQFQADILGIPVNRPANIETTAMGAAYLAGLESGFWNDISELEQLRKPDKIFEPSMPSQQRQDLLAGWHKAVNRVISNPSSDF